MKKAIGYPKGLEGKEEFALTEDDSQIPFEIYESSFSDKRRMIPIYSVCIEPEHWMLGGFIESEHNKYINKNFPNIVIKRQRSVYRAFFERIYSNGKGIAENDPNKMCSPWKMENEFMGDAVRYFLRNNDSEKLEGPLPDSVKLLLNMLKEDRKMEKKRYLKKIANGEDGVDEEEIQIVLDFADSFYNEGHRDGETARGRLETICNQ